MDSYWDGDLIAGIYVEEIAGGGDNAIFCRWTTADLNVLLCFPFYRVLKGRTV